MKPYPIFLVGLDQRHCVVLGGGHEAEFKVKGLLDVDANVTVIAEQIGDRLAEWAEQGRIMWLARRYELGDLRGAWLVIAEQHDAATNAQIKAEAEQERALITVLDDIPNCSAVAGSVVRQGPLAITISTSGAAPALAVRLRQRFEREFGAEYGLFLCWMGELRPIMKATHPRFKERRRRWYEIIDSPALTHIRNGDLDEARRVIAEIVGVNVAQVGRVKA